MSYKAVLLDIEGTTTPVDFVYGTLFPFARKHLESYLINFQDSAAVKADIETLRTEFQSEESASRPVFVDSPLPYLVWLMEQDRKSPALKSLQGKIWEAGYRDGSLKGEIFPDVVDALNRWKANNKTICIYSSGSVLAQKLLFKNSTAGDLSSFISNYFDTSSGAKTESQSYRNIADAMRVSPSDVLFVSDNPKELEAAVVAGMNVAFSVREGNPATKSRFQAETDFANL